MVRIIFVVVVIAGLVILAVQNAATVLPLVMLGQPLMALPLSVWILGAIAAGAMTTLLLAGLLAIGTSRPRRSDHYSPRVTYGFRTPPDPTPSPRDRANAQRAAASAAREIWDEQDFPGATSRQVTDYAAAVTEQRPPQDQAAESWDNRQSLNLDSWDSWGRSNRPPEPSPSNGSDSEPHRRSTPYADAYRPSEPSNASYSPPVVDAEVVSPGQAYAEDSVEEEDAGFSYDVNHSPYASPVEDAFEYGTPNNDDPGATSAQSRPYSAPEYDAPDYGSSSTYDRYSDSYGESYGETRSAAYDEPYDPNPYQDEVDQPEVTYSSPFIYREPGTEFEWPAAHESNAPDASAEPEDGWDDWNQSPAESASSSSGEPEVDSESEQDIWDDWEDGTSNTATPEPSPRITEIQRSPVTQKQTGTVYSYTYRRPDDDQLQSSDDAKNH